MSFLLDTHAFLWAVAESSRLSATAHAIIKNPENRIYVSPVSFWEISLKYSLGKLKLTGKTPDELPAALPVFGFEELALTSEIAASFHGLPRLAHKDPFDRMLICQAIHYRLTLVSADQQLKQYGNSGLKLVW
ncbi:MAG TPA: type II toxin-antitoxin system VapC family toxin [Candidatus Paceibacterota bacterium]|nr:type II toxin-antitoxin system VapC family toxin [Verrucomicrobiota bacterium]HRY50886.1 type II toxin-antitoxin system VapC family toxin [Candidatus Paceibacterota bacterium]